MVEVLYVGGRIRLVAHLLHGGCVEYNPIVADEMMPVLLLSQLSVKLLHALVSAARAFLTGGFPSQLNPVQSRVAEKLRRWATRQSHEQDPMMSSESLPEEVLQPVTDLHKHFFKTLLEDGSTPMQGVAQPPSQATSQVCGSGQLTFDDCKDRLRGRARSMPQRRAEGRCKALPPASQTPCRQAAMKSMTATTSTTATAGMTATTMSMRAASRRAASRRAR